jgi:hypothetical protein
VAVVNTDDGKPDRRISHGRHRSDQPISLPSPRLIEGM